MRWVDASDEQRFWAYIVPAAKQRIESGYWDKFLARVEREGKAAAAKFASMDRNVVDALTYGNARRDVEGLRRDYKAGLHNRAVDIQTLTTASRKKAARATRRKAGRAA
jgi:hypothetical protein